MMLEWRSRARQWREGRWGQGLVEYALILLLVAVVLVGALGTLALDVGHAISVAANAFPP
jgi:Flp pilus assembly pilin Flp